jgi:hypothetical protein
MHPQPTPWSDLENILQSESPQIWLDRMAQLDTNAFNQHKIALLRFATGDQFKQLIELAEQSGIDEHPFIELRSTLERFNPNTLQTPGQYQRLDYHNSDHILHHYRWLPSADEPLSPSHSQSTVIGFTGDASILMAPVACILAILGESRQDLLLVKRLIRKPYCEDDASLLSSVEQQICSLITQQELAHGQARHLISLGTSTGGLAALTLAHRLALPLGVGVGALMPIPLGRHRAQWFAQLQIRAQPTGPGTNPERHTKVGRAHARTKLRLAAGAASAGDRTHALRVRAFYTQHHPNTTSLEVKLMPGCSSHGLFEELAQQGRSLDTVLPELLRLESEPPVDATSQAVAPLNASSPDQQA